MTGATIPVKKSYLTWLLKATFDLSPTGKLSESNGIFTRNGIAHANLWLDLVRASAILLVLLRHGERALVSLGDKADSVFETIFINGWVGVDLFLALSGYLIARHLLKSGIGAPDFNVGRYLAMRALRIVPAYFVVIALVVAGAFPYFRLSPENLPLRIGYHLLFLQDYLPSDINVVFWSLGVEEKFYILAPLLVFALLRCSSNGQRAALLAICFALPVIFRALSYAQLSGPIEFADFFRQFRTPFHVTLEGFAIGVSVAIAERYDWIALSRNAALALLGVSFAALIALLASHDFLAEITAYDATLQPAIIALLAGGMVLGAANLRDAPLLLRGPVQTTAQLSYSLYLVHFPLIPLVAPIATTLGAIAFWPAYFFVSFIASALLYLSVERPFLLLKDRLRSTSTAIGDNGAARATTV